MDLWNRYRTDGDEQARETLLVENLPLVRHVALKLLKSSGADGELDDLVSAGTIGLMQAVETFDHERGLAFSTFATPRIRGAILDDLRRRDHVPRSVRRKQRALDRARQSVGGTSEYSPGDNELARELEVDVETLWRWRLDAEQAFRVPLHTPSESDGEKGRTPAQVLEGESGEEVFDRLEREEMASIVRGALEDLNQQERTVLSLYYFEELKLHEIAPVLDVTPSRISQIRTAALRKLRGRLEHLTDPAAAAA